MQSSRDSIQALDLASPLREELPKIVDDRYFSRRQRRLRDPHTDDTNATCSFSEWPVHVLHPNFEFASRFPLGLRAQSHWRWRRWRRHHWVIERPPQRLWTSHRHNRRMNICMRAEWVLGNCDRMSHRVSHLNLGPCREEGQEEH